MARSDPELLETARGLSKQTKPVTHKPVLMSDTLLNKIARGVIFLRNDGVVAYMNECAARLLNICSESVVGKRVDMLPLRAPAYKVLSEINGKSSLEMSINGHRIAISPALTVEVERGMQGKMIELWDITEEKRAKRRLEDFVATVTHDLRSPLTIAMGYLQSMRLGMYGVLGKKVVDAVLRAEQGCKKLNAMIDEMLYTHRLEMGLQGVSRSICDMGQIISECYRDHFLLARQQGVDLILEEMAETPKVTVDRKQIARVLNNLIGNAVKFTPEGGRVTIGAEVSAGIFTIFVADTGIGIPHDDLTRIFYKYYRSAHSMEYKGSGLGLSIGKTIVEAHGGNVSVESTVGAGSTFRVAIPLDDPEEFDATLECIRPGLP